MLRPQVVILICAVAAGPFCTAASAVIDGTDTRFPRRIIPSVLPPCSFITDDNTTYFLKERDCRPTGRPLHPGQAGTQPGAQRVVIKSNAAKPEGNSVPGSVVWPALDGGGQTLVSDDTGAVAVGAQLLSSVSRRVVLAALRSLSVVLS